MSKNCPKIIQKLSTHTEIIQKSSSSIQKIYNNCAKNCNTLLIEALQFLAQLLYIFCMELDDFWIISVCVDNFWMIFGHFFFIGLGYFFGLKCLFFLLVYIDIISGSKAPDFRLSKLFMTFLLKVQKLKRRLMMFNLERTRIKRMKGMAC